MLSEVAIFIEISMKYVLNMMKFVLKMRKCALKMMVFVFKMMILLLEAAWRTGRTSPLAGLCGWCVFI